MDIQAFADLGFRSFETRTRLNENTFVTIRDNDPNHDFWLQLVYDVHDSMGEPSCTDDYIFQFVQDALETIARGETGMPDPDAYTGELLRYLGAGRLDRVDDVLVEMARFYNHYQHSFSLTDAIQRAQIEEMNEVYYHVNEWLEEHLDDLDDEIE